MKKNIFLIVLISLIVLPVHTKSLLAADDKFSIGLKAGFNKLEGDWSEPRFNPMGSFVLSYAPIPYFEIGTEINYSLLRTQDGIKDLQQVARVAGANSFALPLDHNKFETFSMPIELDFRFNFSPRTAVNPFASIGFGGLMWDARYDGSTIVQPDEDPQEQKSFGLLFKTSAGLSFNFNNGLALSLGADYRFTGTDWLDQRPTGDMNDGITSLWAGLSYYFEKKDPADLDGDNIPKNLDLDLYRAEDRNGFWDHDGKPDFGKSAQTKKGPSVIHYPVFRAEEGRDMIVKAVITSEVPLRTATVLYRTKGTKKWKLAPLKNSSDMYYETIIKGANLTTTGLEYCVVAVDNDLKGIGYSGLPKRPIQVKVEKSGRNWRVVAGIVAFFGWGAATYIVMRKQNI